MSSKSELTPSTEDYLEAIYNLNVEGGGVRSVDVAEKLNVSKPSVNRALRNLSDSGLIIQEKYALIYLTEAGKLKAEEIFHRHTTIRSFLKDVLGLDAGTAEEEACKIEHVMSNDTVDKISKLISAIQNSDNKNII